MPLFNPTAGGGGGIPEWAILPVAYEEFPKGAEAASDSESWFPGILYGSVRCSISDAVPDAVVWCRPNTSWTASSGKPSAFPYMSVDTIDAGTLPLSTAVVSDTTDFQIHTAQLFGYGSGFGQFTYSYNIGSAFYDTFSLWNPAGNGGSGGWVNIVPPEDLVATHAVTPGSYDPGVRFRAGGVGRDGKLYYAQLVKPGSSSENTQPKYVSVWRFDHNVGDVYSGTWTLVESFSVTPPAVTAANNALWISGGGWLGAGLAGSDSSGSGYTTFTLRLDGTSSPSIGSATSVADYYPFYTTKADAPVYYEVLNNDGAGKLKVITYEHSGATTEVTTGIDLQTDRGFLSYVTYDRTVFSDRNGRVWVVAARLIGGTDQWVEVYRVDPETGGSVLVEERYCTWVSSSNASNRVWQNMSAICSGFAKGNPRYRSFAPSNFGDDVMFVLPKNDAVLKVTTNSYYSTPMGAWYWENPNNFEVVFLSQ